MFLLGWFAGLFGVAFGVVALEDVFAYPDGGASTTSGILELVLGLMFLVFAVYSWRSRNSNHNSRGSVCLKIPPSP